MSSFNGAFVRAFMPGPVDLVNSIQWVINGSFDSGIVGYSARGSSTISWDAQGALQCSINGFGGGFTTHLIASTQIQVPYEITVDIKSEGYDGVLKGKVGLWEFDLTPTGITTEWATYKASIYGQVVTDKLEIYRDDGSTGSLLFDNLSVKQTPQYNG